MCVCVCVYVYVCVYIYIYIYIQKLIRDPDRQILTNKYKIFENFEKLLQLISMT